MLDLSHFLVTTYPYHDYYIALKAVPRMGEKMKQKWGPEMYDGTY